MRRIAVALTLSASLLAGACIQPASTGVLEEDELYNTMGLGSLPLFGPEGIAPVSASTQPFCRVGLMWDAPEGTRLEGRIGDAAGGWSGWFPIEPRWTEGIAHTGHVDVPWGQAELFQLRIAAGPQPSHLIAEGLAQIGEVQLEAAPELEPYAQTRQALGPSWLVHSRSDWGARQPACSSGSHSPSKATIHHTATPLPDSISPPARMRQMQAYHIDTRGWCDIGYHFVVDRNGEIWQGRNETVIGAHVANNNTNNVGISYMGTYNSVAPTATQIDRGATLLSWLNERYGIPLDRSHVKGHREYRGNSSGDCPGDQIQSRLSQLLGGGSGDPGGGQESGTGTLQGVIFADTGSGTADMSIRIPGSTVSAGGQSTGARSGDAYWSFSLPPGTYGVTASAPGYQSATRTCSLAAGEQAWCSIGLVEASGTGAAGELLGVVFVDTGAGTADMSQRVPGAEVRAGSASAKARDGDAYWSLSLPEGSYTVVASASGYRDGSRSCTVSAGQQTWCSVGVLAGGGDPGGEDPGGEDPGGGDPGGENPGGEPKGRIYGYVIEFTSADAFEACEGPRIAGAEVRMDSGEIVQTGSDAFFELWVEPGDHVVAASAAGYLDGGYPCSVEPGGESLCCIAVLPDGPPQSGSESQDPGEDGSEPDEMVGCSSASAPGSLLAGIVLIVLLSRRRLRP